jgi:hypothetical protein
VKCPWLTTYSTCHSLLSIRRASKRTELISGIDTQRKELMMHVTVQCNEDFEESDTQNLKEVSRIAEPATYVSTMRESLDVEV